MVKSSIIVIAGSLILILLSISWCKNWENTESHFSTYDEAKEAGMMIAGWLPEYLPKSATDIHEQHNIDTNLVYATFKYDPDKVTSLAIFCPRNEELENGTRHFCNDGSGLVVLDLYHDGTGKINHDNEHRF